jgi:threonine/homoserine/homoserine lactone efflux protein
VIVLAYLVLGLVLGAGSSVMPGPCGLAVIRAATQRGLQRALGVALGAAGGDLTYASLGVLGVGPLLARHPSLPPVLQAVSGLVLVGYGLRHLRGRAPGVPVDATDGWGDERRGEVVRGLALGVAALLANPGAMLTWVVVLGSLLTGASTVEGLATAAGIGCGSCAWFALMALVAHRGRNRGPLLARVTALVSGVLVMAGVLALARAAQSWLAI